MKNVLKSFSFIVMLTMFVLVAFSSNSNNEQITNLKSKSESKVVVEDVFARCFKCESCTPLPDGSQDCSGCVEIPCPPPQQ